MAAEDVKGYDDTKGLAQTAFAAVASLLSGPAPGADAKPVVAAEEPKAQDTGVPIMDAAAMARMSGTQMDVLGNGGKNPGGNAMGTTPVGKNPNGGGGPSRGGRGIA